MFKASMHRFLASLLLVSLMVGLTLQTMQGTAMALQMTFATSADLAMSDGCDDGDSDTSAYCLASACIGQSAIASEDPLLTLARLGSLRDHTYAFYSGRSPSPDPRPPQRFPHT